MQVSKMKTINIMPFTKITMKSMCTARAYAMFLLTNKQKFVNKHPKIMHKLNNRKEREQITAIKKGAFSKYEKL